MLTENERLQKVIEAEQLTAKQFSEEIGIQPGTVSNILKGRNKPSLEVMQKVLNRFRTISPEWLILGVGTMYRQKNDSRQTMLFDIPPISNIIEDNVDQERERQRELAGLALDQLGVIQKQQQEAHEMQFARKISRVVIFFDDGTYDEFGS